MEWKEVRLGDVCNIITGFPFPGKKYSKEGIRVVRGDNVTIGNLRWDTEKDKRWNEPFDKTEYYSLQANDIVIGMDGSRVGKNKARIKEEDLPLLLAQRVACVRHNELAEQDYLYYNIFSKKFIDYVNSIHTGSAIPHISQKQIEDYKILLPNLETQRRIASILSSLDRKIELNNKINADLEEMAQAIFKNWFVDFEPFKDGKFVDSELGMIPEGWKVGCLGDLITIKYGKDHKKLDDGTFPVYGSGGFMRFVNSWLYNGESVLIPRKGTLDNIMYVCEKFWTVDTMFFSVPKMDYVMKYVYNYIKRFDFSKMNEGTSVPSNTAARLNKMPILIPTHKILEMYDETLCPIYNKRKMKDKESRTLSLVRDTLLPRLMSGELEVPE